MIASRQLHGARENEALEHVRARGAETNSQWLARTGVENGIVLLGGTSLADFRLRVAQSHLRSDLLPSFWSFAGILRQGSRIDMAALAFGADVSAVPPNNGITRATVSRYDDPSWYPNVAVIEFGVGVREVRDAIEQVRGSRSVVDLPRLVLAWLGFVWGASDRGNPLLDGMGMPSAAFVESVYAIAGMELTPGLSSSASCPEAIWQAAKWWRTYYEERYARAESDNPTESGGAEASLRAPRGKYVTRQRAAAVYDPTDDAAQAKDRRATSLPPRRARRRTPKRTRRAPSGK